MDQGPFSLHLVLESVEMERFDAREQPRPIDFGKMDCSTFKHGFPFLETLCSTCNQFNNNKL